MTSLSLCRMANWRASSSLTAQATGRLSFQLACVPVLKSTRCGTPESAAPEAQFRQSWEPFSEGFSGQAAQPMPAADLIAASASAWSRYSIARPFSSTN
jgi:hypothetical protein